MFYTRAKSADHTCDKMKENMTEVESSETNTTIEKEKEQYSVYEILPFIA